MSVFMGLRSRTEIDTGVDRSKLYQGTYEKCSVHCHFITKQHGKKEKIPFFWIINSMSMNE
jgi:hypothetical protein